MEFSGGRRPSIASEVTDLPEPDSPTSAIVLFFGMSNEMPFTASNTVFLSSGTELFRLRTLTSVSMAVVIRSGPQPSFEFRIQRIAQRVGEEAERRDEQC